VVAVLGVNSALIHPQPAHSGCRGETRDPKGSLSDFVCCHIGSGSVLGTRR